MEQGRGGEKSKEFEMMEERERKRKGEINGELTEVRRKRRNRRKGKKRKRRKYSTSL